MIKRDIISFLSFLLMLQIGCQPKENINRYSDKFEILINRYLNLEKIRYSENTGWATIGGVYKIGFDPADNTKPRSGRFIIEMINYADPLCPMGQTCSCTGLLSGAYEADDYKAAKESDTPQAPYDPLKPYNEDPDTGQSSSNVVGFKLALKIEKRSLSPECPEFLDYDIVINVYSGQKAILGESNKEFYITIPPLK